MRNENSIYKERLWLNGKTPLFMLIMPPRPVFPKALEAALPYFTEQYGNASSIYTMGMNAAKAILKAREQVADAIGAKVNEIYFTSGGSEADNWAIRGSALNGAKKGKKHIITTVFEHHAVLHTC